MSSKNNNSLDAAPLIEELTTTLNTGLNNLVQDFTYRYNMLEETHRQIMQLPNVQDALSTHHLKNNKSYKIGASENQSENDNNLDTISTLVSSLIDKKMNHYENKRHEEMKEYVNAISEKCLAYTTDSFEKINILLSTVNIGNKNNISINIEHEDESVIEEENENLINADVVNNVMMKEITIQEEEEEEEEENNDSVSLVSSDLTSDEEEDDAKESEEEKDSKVEEHEQSEVEVEEEDLVEQSEEEVEEEEHSEVEVEDDDLVEQSEEELEEVEEHSEEDVEEQKEDEHSEEEQSESDDDEEEVYEITIDDTIYFTTDNKNGVIYECVDDDVGNQVGKYKNGIATFF